MRTSSSVEPRGDERLRGEPQPALRAREKAIKGPAPSPFEASGALDVLSGQHPLRHLRRVQGILRLAKRYPITAEALDHALPAGDCLQQDTARLHQRLRPLLCHPRPKTHASSPKEKTGYRSSAPIRRQLGLRSRTVAAVGGGGTAMNTSLKSSPNDIFHLPEQGSREKRPPQRPYKRRSRFDPYLGYPQKQPFHQEVSPP